MTLSRLLRSILQQANRAVEIQTFPQRQVLLPKQSVQVLLPSFSTESVRAGLATEAISAGIATFATTAGVSTQVSGYLGVGVTGTNLNVTGVITATRYVVGEAEVTGHTETDTLNVSGITTVNSLQVETFSTFNGNTKHFDGKYANFGNGTDLQIVHDGSNAVIQNATGQFFIDNNASGGDLFLRANDNVVIRVDGNDTVLTAQTGGIDVTGHTETDNLNVSGVSTFQSHVHLGDDDELRFGASNDFKIVHDPNDCRFENSNGDIKFKNTGSYFFFDEDGGETLASFINDGAVNLFHAGSKKFTTTGYGVTVTGIVSATSFVGDGSGLTGIIASGTGIVIKDDGSDVGTASTINFGTGLNVEFASGIATVTGSGGGGSDGPDAVIMGMIF